jgi:hypothetical protein
MVAASVIKPAVARAKPRSRRLLGDSGSRSGDAVEPADARSGAEILLVSGVGLHRLPSDRVHAEQERDRQRGGGLPRNSVVG